MSVLLSKKLKSGSSPGAQQLLNGKQNRPGIPQCGIRFGDERGMVFRYILQHVLRLRNPSSCIKISVAQTWTCPFGLKCRESLCHPESHYSPQESILTEAARLDLVFVSCAHLQAAVG